MPADRPHVGGDEYLNSVFDGTWAFIVAALQLLVGAAGHVNWDVSVDSGTARVHQRAVECGTRPNY